MEKTLEQLFDEFKKLPDWDRFPMPEIFYTHFGVKKPQPANVSELVNYCPPPAISLGKTEIRKPAEGGVRQIEELPPLPVSVEVIQDQDVDQFIPEAKIYNLEDVSGGKVITQISDDKKQDSDQNSLNHPTEHNNSETQHVSDRQSPSPYDASLCTFGDAPYHDAECNPPSQQPQNQHSSLAPYQTETPLSISFQT